MKKIFLIFLSLLVLLHAAGCSASTQLNHSDRDHTQSQDSPASTTAGTPSDNANTDEGVTTFAIEGETADNTYTNAHLGLTFTKPDSWAFFPKDALAGLTGADTTLSVAENANTNGAAYDMMALDPTKNTSVSLVFENLEITAGGKLSAQEYLDTVIKAGLQQTPESELTEEATITIGGNSYVKATIQTSDHNTPMTQIHYLRDMDVYMVHITATVPSSNVADVDFDAMLS